MSGPTDDALEALAKTVADPPGWKFRGGRYIKIDRAGNICRSVSDPLVRGIDMVHALEQPALARVTDPLLRAAIRQHADAAAEHLRTLAALVRESEAPDGG